MKGTLTETMMTTTLITFCVSRRRRKMYCGHVCVCLCACVCVIIIIIIMWSAGELLITKREPPSHEFAYSLWCD